MKEDTFQLPMMIRLGVATVEGRHWCGQKLILLCDVSAHLLARLIQDKNAAEMTSRPNEYELPDQDWLEPVFE